MLPISQHIDRLDRSSLVNSAMTRYIFRPASKNSYLQERPAQLGSDALPTLFMERTFKRQIESLSDIFAFLKVASASFSLDDRTSFSVNMAVEELFTNMIKYGASGGKEIFVGLKKNKDRLSVHLIDYESSPFDLTELDEVDTSAPLDKRRPGGLGIHLVKCLMDEVTYEYKNGTTHILLAKNI